MPSSESLLESIRRAVGDHPAVAAAYLYGSAAADRASGLSDIDVAVLVGADLHEDDDARELALARLGTALASELRRASGADRPPPVDLRDLESLPLALQGRILTDGRLAVSNDDVRRVRFETTARQRYFDFLPFLRRDTREGLTALRKHYLDG